MSSIAKFTAYDLQILWCIWNFHDFNRYIWSLLNKWCRSTGKSVLAVLRERNEDLWHELVFITVYWVQCSRKSCAWAWYISELPAIWSKTLLSLLCHIRPLELDFQFEIFKETGVLRYHINNVAACYVHPAISEGSKMHSKSRWRRGSSLVIHHLWKKTKFERKLVCSWNSFQHMISMTSRSSCGLVEVARLELWLQWWHRDNTASSSVGSVLKYDTSNHEFHAELPSFRPPLRNYTNSPLPEPQLRLRLSCSTCLQLMNLWTKFH